MPRKAADPTKVKHGRALVTWTSQQLRALDLVFEGRKKCTEIAAELGIAEDTFKDWRASDVWKAKLAERREKLIESLDDVAYVRKEERLIALSQMAEKARLEFEERPRLIERRPTGRDENGGLLIMEQEAFNKDAHEAFRAAIADIAAELGARKNVTEFTATVEVNQRVTFYLPHPEIVPADE